jgi:hypothetical protein
MNKRGNISKLWISMFWLIIAVVIFYTLLGVVSSGRDDTGYNLKFYPLDMAYGLEQMSIVEGEVSYVYDIKEGYYVSEINDEYLSIKKGNAWQSQNFKQDEDYEFSASLINDGESILFEKKERTI